MNDEVRIFISYARLDAGEVSQLYHRLKAAGFRVWIDREDLLPGVKWREAIEDAIREADFFLLCLSSRSSNRRGFLQREINAALDLWEERMSDDIYFIPLRLEVCEMPERVGEFQCVDWFEDGGWERLIKALRVQVERLGKRMPEPGDIAQPSPTAAPVVIPSQRPSDDSIFDFVTVTVDDRGVVIDRQVRQARRSIEEWGGAVRLELVEIAGGEFWMGSSEAEAQAAFADAKLHYEGASEAGYIAEVPRHRVKLSPFSMGKYPVTQSQWYEVMGDLPEIPDNLRGGEHPVVMVSWEEADDFCQELSRRTRRQYRLPTEAEWEYACRAGTNTPFAFGQNINPEIVNYAGNHPYGSAPQGVYAQKPVPVGSLGVANAFGLYDMHGNVWEWCSDWYSNSYYEECHKQGVEPDPPGPDTGSVRVYRGGGWRHDAVNCRSANRGGVAPGFRYGYLSFRLVRAGR